MKSRLPLFLMLAGCTGFFMGCGSKQTGTYTGSESVNSPGTAALNESSVNLNIQNEDGNNNMTGSFTDQAGTSSFSGTVSSDGTQIQSVSLTIPAQPAGATVNGVPSTGCGGTYTGSLTLNSGAITGSLTLTSPQALTPTANSYGTNSQYGSQYPTNNQYGTTTSALTGTNPCTGATRSVNLNKSS